MTSDSGDAYEFYPCLVDDAPASIYVNLRFEQEPLAGADTHYGVTIQMLEPGPYGIGTADEGDAVNAIEETLIAQVRERGLVYVGRLRSRGEWEVTFYGADGHLETLRAIARDASVGGRRAAARSQHDRDWTYYRELLLPDAERRQWMDDRRLVQVLRDQGDALRTPRRVDHRAHFASAQARDAFVAAITGKGFALEVASQDEARERPFGAHVFRTDCIELDHIHDVVMTVVDAAILHGGEYGGWTTSIERG